MNASTTTLKNFDDLSSCEQKLLRACQRICFGTLYGLGVSGGQPVFDPAPRMRRKLRLTEKSIHSQPKRGSFALKDKHRLLIELIRKMDCGVIEKIEVRDGLPELISIDSEVI